MKLQAGTCGKESPARILQEKGKGGCWALEMSLDRTGLWCTNCVFRCFYFQIAHSQGDCPGWLHPCPTCLTLIVLPKVLVVISIRVGGGASTIDAADRLPVEGPRADVAEAADVQTAVHVTVPITMEGGQWKGDATHPSIPRQRRRGDLGARP